MEEVASTIQNAIANTPVGEKVKIEFGGIPKIINVTMTFAGGWVVDQTIIPGKTFEFTRGDDQYLKDITITINDYDGLK